MLPPPRTLLDHHLAFLAAHRGQVDHTLHGTAIVSSRPEFTYLVPEPEADLDFVTMEFRQVHVAPWSEVLVPLLVERGYVEKARLTYMACSPAALVGPDMLAQVEIRLATSAEAIEVFGEVQSRGFLESDASYQAFAPFLKEANQHNRTRPEQTFYIAEVDGVAAGVTLLLMHEHLGGIYAVATLPAYRHRGLASLLLTRAGLDAKNLGGEALTLQVFAGSGAERLYTRQGFTPVFQTRIFEAASAQA